MVEIAELLRRVEAMERDGSAAALTRMEHRIGRVEDRIEAHNTVLGKALVILEETRLRVSVVEGKQDQMQSELSALRRDFDDFQRRFAGEVAVVMRDVLKEQRGE